MEDKRKEFDEQTYSPETNCEMTHLQQEGDMTNEASLHRTIHGEERYSESQQKLLADSDMAECAQRLAANYLRSLFLF